MSGDRVVVIFCKAPVAGQVKTRLMPFLNGEQAAQIHRELSLRTLQWVTDSQLCPVQLWCAPSIDHPFFAETAAQFPVTLHQQHGQHLGERMHHAFTSALQHYRQVLLMGCDCPSLTADDLRAAFLALDSHDVVLAPAEDGGYTLIGLKQAHPALFTDIAWGSDQVLAQTRLRIAQQQLTLGLLSEQWDVDRPEDLQRYRLLVAKPD
ncbi:TIGR04282 family arsenosugar biosynthesis glycosyltransferase [Methylosoma difficile]